MTEPFVTKDSGERMEFSTGMRRDTNIGKPRFDLVSPVDLPYDEQFLTRLASLMARGAEKYGDRNWEKAKTRAELERYLDSAERHFHQWKQQVRYRARMSRFAGDGVLEEDHGAAVGFNIIGAEYVAFRMEMGDD